MMRTFLNFIGCILEMSKCYENNVTEVIPLHISSSHLFRIFLWYHLLSQPRVSSIIIWQLSALGWCLWCLWCFWDLGFSIRMIPTFFLLPSPLAISAGSF